MNECLRRKEIIFIALFIIFLLSFTACSKKKDQTVDNPVTPVPEQAAGDGVSAEITGEALPDISPSPEAAVSITPAGTENGGMNEDSLPYKILETSYLSDNVIRIYYPQLTGLSNQMVQSKINDTIKTEAMKYTEGFHSNGDGAALQINYEITWEGSRLLSIRYICYWNEVSAAHPSTFVYTENFNIETGEEIRLSDMVRTDDIFVQSLKDNGSLKYYYYDENGKLKTDDSFHKPDITAPLRDYVFGNDSNIDYNKADDKEDYSPVKSYFTGDSLGISIDTPHAAGDHIEIEITFKDMFHNINMDNPLWNDFPEAKLQVVTTDVTPAIAPEQVTNDINEEEINKNTNYVPGFYIIKDQSFWVELENWGKVYFISAGGEGEFGLNSLYMYLVDKDSRILYEFPYFYGNGMLFSSIHAISFKDVNNDGLKDIIVIAGYMTGIGPTGAQEFPVASIYFQKGKEFVTIPSLDDDMNASEKNGTVGEIMEYLKETNIPLNIE